LDDSKIIELFFERSEQAIIELSKKYGSICNRVANNILNNKLDSEECVNDAYFAVWNAIPPQKPDPLLSYVCRIVRNLAIKKYHANTALKRNSIYDVCLDEIVDYFPSASSVEEEVDAREAAETIDKYLETLDQQSRIMFVRRYWHSDSIGDLAKLFHISKHAVSVRLSRIRKNLRKYLIKEGVPL
jgi:RNA polymerase sigma-70 factor (ECF subfamily)